MVINSSEDSKSKTSNPSASTEDRCFATFNLSSSIERGDPLAGSPPRVPQTTCQPRRRALLITAEPMKPVPPKPATCVHTLGQNFIWAKFVVYVHYPQPVLVSVKLTC
ncbi:hypothetical protein TRVL_03939 [Trypanosoma vivax]|nr:hypothetical protein TRVL_03939 [Trypanosoma vivax]